MTPTAHSASNGAAETTMKVIRKHANLWIQQVEKGCGLGEVIGCHHPLYQRVLLHSCWLHNRFVVRQSHTAYDLCANMPYTARLALFGERVLGFVNLSTKSFPTWTKGICNDVHIIAVPGGPPLFVTRCVRRLPKPWDMQMVGEVEASPWQFGYASLGAQLILSKRISAPPILSLPPARSRGLDAEAVMGIPPTPNEVGDEAPKSPRVFGPPSSAGPALSGETLDEHMEVLAEALTKTNWTWRSKYATFRTSSNYAS